MGFLRSVVLYLQEGVVDEELTALCVAPSLLRGATMARSPMFTRVMTASVALVSVGLLLISAPAHAAPGVDEPIGLGTAASFGVLGATTVTNTGPSVIGGDVGVSPGTAIVGFPPGIIVDGVEHSADAEAAKAQSDLTTAYNVAASLTPDDSGLGELTGLSLTPGVYSGGELSLTGELTLAGTAESVWVFQAASTLTAESGAQIILTGGATACNVFWQVGSSATLDSGSQFVGTVMAKTSITAVTGARIDGRLLAGTGAVTLDTNTVTAPVGCNADDDTASTSPSITSSAPPAATVGAEYSFTVTATGTPVAIFSVTPAALPAGLSLDSTTGVISGVPTTAGTSTFTITASNGTAPDATESYTVVTSAPAVTPATPEIPEVIPAAPAVVPVTPGELVLAETGAEPNLTLLAVGALLVLGGLVVLVKRRHRSHSA
jgi:LPXTG-motif cell wall-anchored protein